MTDPIPFGRYQLLNLLGKGGMARVYRGVRAGPMGFEKPVALKLIDSDVTENPRMLKALTNEARLGGQLHHRNVVEIYEFDHVDGAWFMAMEYVDGWTLDIVLNYCRLHRNFLPAKVVWELMIDTCRGLDYAHGLEGKDGEPLGLVHRDLKPGNIIVSRTGDVKILDFGIAKATSNLYQTTAADTVKGTPIYMSPEQANGVPLDRRSDLFALGGVMHELITLQVPFQGDSLGAVVAGILKGDITRPMERVREKADVFCPLLEKLLAHDREERLNSAADVMEELESIRGDLPPGENLRKWIGTLAEDLPDSPGPSDYGTDGPTTLGVIPVRDPLGRAETVQRPVGSKGGKKKKKSNTGMIAAAALIFVAALAVVGWAAMQTMAEDPEPVAEATPQATPAVAEATPVPTPEATPEPTPAPVAAATPKPRSTPAPVAEPTPRSQAQGLRHGQLQQQEDVVAHQGGREAHRRLAQAQHSASGGHPHGGVRLWRVRSCGQPDQDVRGRRGRPRHGDRQLLAT